MICQYLKSIKPCSHSRLLTKGEIIKDVEDSDCYYLGQVVKIEEDKRFGNVELYKVIKVIWNGEEDKESDLLGEVIKPQWWYIERVDLQELQQKVIQHFMDKHNEKLRKILESELQYLGIKPPFTKGKMKWHGIKLLIHNNIQYIKYQLVQRGKLIKSFTIY
jgi:hypothetical protein